MSIDDKGLPKVKYAIVISMDMNFKVWHKENVVSFTRLEHIPKRKELSYFNEILQIIDFLQQIVMAKLLIHLRKQSITSRN